MQSFFSQLKLFLENKVAPLSNELDSDSSLLKGYYERLIGLGGLRLLIPSSCGGLGGERREWIEYSSQLAEYSGALLFLQAQHQYVIAKLKKLLPDTKIEFVLQSLAKDNRGVGVAFAAHKKILTVKKCPTGFSISGTLKWVTGWDYFSRIFFSFDQDGIEYYLFLPFKTSGSSLIVSPVIESIVFTALNTVTITLKDYSISSEEIITARPCQPKKPSEHPAIYHFLGAAKALLTIASSEKYSFHPLVKNTLNQLLDEWKLYYNQIMQGESPYPLKMRARGLKLAEKCLSLAKLTCGSGGLLRSHAVTRLSREIWQYSIGGYSEDQLEAYLE